MNKIIAIVGMCGSGKTVATELFEEAGYKKIYIGAITFEELARRGLEVNEQNERLIREEFRSSGDKAIYSRMSLPKIEELYAQGNVVVESMYSWSEYKLLKEHFGDAFEVLAIVTNAKLRRERLVNRPLRPFSLEDSKSRDYAEIENIEKAGPIGIADYYITNNGSEEEYKQKVIDFIKEYTNK